MYFDSPHLVGLCGLSGNGKSRLADEAQNLCDKVQILSVASTLKKKAASFADIEEELLLQDKEGFRPLLVALGAAGRDSLGLDHWLNDLKERYAALPAGTIVFIDDIRYENEAEWVRSEGGLIVNVSLVDQEIPDNRHKSEMPELLNADWFVINDKHKPQLLVDAARNILCGEANQKVGQPALEESAN